MKPVVMIISDALGETAHQLARAAMGQFDVEGVRYVRLSKVRDGGDVAQAVASYIDAGDCISVLYTVVDSRLREDIGGLFERLGVPAVDVLGPVLAAFESSTGLVPQGVPGAIHRTDEGYFKRIDAMEYFVEHDDGRGADDLSDADIVLIGVSRTGKTPLSMYLAYLGYRVANIPLALGIEPPPSLFEVEPRKIFGLISTVDLVSTIRDSRLGGVVARGVAGSYADRECVAQEMDEARLLFRRLGCFVVRTDGKAIEESASEIITRLDRISAGRAHRKSMPDNQTI